VIPASRVDYIRDQLDICAVDERHLFPGLDGIAAEFTPLLLQFPVKPSPALFDVCCRRGICVRTTREITTNRKTMSTSQRNRCRSALPFFNGNCEQAVDFYRKALGAEVEMMMRFKESPEAPPPGTVPAGYDDKIMHTELPHRQTTVMASTAVKVGALISRTFLCRSLS